MNIEIGPYKVIRRTEYSKAMLIDKNTDENITKKYPEVLEKILSDYEEQMKNPDCFFTINGNKLIKFNIMNAENIEYVFIPETIEYIGDYSFSDGKFKYVHIPQSVKYIEDFAFINCHLLENIDLPESLMDIAAGAFFNCYHLKSVSLPSEIYRLNYKTFSGCKMLEHVDIPDKVEFISNCIFQDCINLKNIKLPKELRTLGDSVFSGCENLRDIILPDFLNFIGSGCFLNCFSLKNIELPDNIVRLCSRTFFNCSGLESIKLPKELENIPDELFSGCESLKHIELPDTVKSIGEGAFRNTYKVHSINIPRDLKHIGASPFKDSKIKKIYFNHDLPYLTTVFYGLTYESSVERLVINNNVNVISAQALSETNPNITKIDYSGTKKEYKRFKNNNSELFEYLPNVMEIKLVNGFAKDKETEEIEESR